jgi:peptidoglycan/LPS O-acetylase OafA/YrhL
MITPPEPPPDVGHRVVAVIAIVLFALVVAATFVTVVGDIPRLVAQLALLAAAALAAWYGLTRVGGRRAIAILVAIAALTGLVLVGIAKEGGGPASLLARVILLLLAVALSVVDAIRRSADSRCRLPSTLSAQRPIGDEAHKPSRGAAHKDVATQWNSPPE